MRETLSAQPQAGNCGTVPLDILVCQVRQHAPPLAHELEQPTARVVIVLMLAQMVRQPIDALCEQRDLHLGGAGVLPVGPELRDDDFFLLALQRHAAITLSEIEHHCVHKQAHSSSAQPMQYTIRSPARLTTVNRRKSTQMGCRSRELIDSREEVVATLGVIGGSGVYALADLAHVECIDVETPFGRPSSGIVKGEIGPTTVLFVPRHGPGHVYSPSEVPYRANIHALKQLGATHLLSLSAVGSLREDLPPRSLLLPDQIIDRTLGRERTFFERGIVAHVGLADPFCSSMQDAVSRAAVEAGVALDRGGAYVCIEGPQFSTRAESQLYRSWGAAVIGMTAMPEARLAREAELCYATLAMITDYDVWHESEADVSVEVVASHLEANGRAAVAILSRLAERGLPPRACPCGSALDCAIITDSDHVPPEARARVRVLVGDRLDPS